jgi:hypothetical protein
MRQQPEKNRLSGRLRCLFLRGKDGQLCELDLSGLVDDDA